jgi:hypothetical protein
VKIIKHHNNVGRMKRSASGNGAGNDDNAGYASLDPAYAEIRAIN